MQRRRFDTMMEFAWLIPLFPLVSFVFLLLFGNVIKGKAAYIGIFLTLVSLVLSLLVLFDRFHSPSYKASAEWLAIGKITIDAGFTVNQLNALMLVIVSLISLLVQVYSKGYMSGDQRFSVFYSYLGLFTFAMLGLVISPNLLQLYMFWELVGLGSFLLIGFYFQKEEAKQAAKKAFIMTRIGDVGLLIGILLLFWQTHSFSFDVIFSAVQTGSISSGMVTIISILIFIGAVGKSGQFPLHSWLPDAMEGPTPVSALIHAATMVAAGVYLVATMFPFFSGSETAMWAVAVTGGFTAIFAASIALVQKDIKRILAYSTISQLGYMMLALGTSGYTAGIFHLMTHAFFKALLFLAAGSVIHAVHTQDIEKMGGLWRKMKLTGPLFLIGTLSISGVPLFSGFFSKDEILASAWAGGNDVLFWLALVTAFLTSFYMFRLFFMVFAGSARSERESIQESPASMTGPMMILGILSVGSGYVNTPWFGSFLGNWLAKGNTSLPGPGHIEAPSWIMIAAAAVSLCGILLAYLIYGNRSVARNWLMNADSPIFQTLFNKFFIDEIYFFSIGKAVKGFSLFLSGFERFVLGGLAGGVAGAVHSLGKSGSRLQTGHVQLYGTIAFFCIAAIMVIYALTGGYIL